MNEVIEIDGQFLIKTRFGSYAHGANGEALVFVTYSAAYQHTMKVSGEWAAEIAVTLFDDMDNW